MTTHKDRLAQENARVVAGGGPARQNRHKRLGRWDIRTRIDKLLDADSFVEIARHKTHMLAQLDPTLASNQAVGDAFVCGLGTINGTEVAVCGHDPTVLRGAMGSVGAQKYCKMMAIAYERRLPVITFADSDGARLAEGVLAIESIAQAMDWTIRHRTVAPHLTIVAGLCVGAAAYIAALADFVVMVKSQSFMFLTGPTVTGAVTGQEVDINDLGGDVLHTKTTGCANAVVDSEQDAVDWVHRVLAFNTHPQIDTTDDAKRLVPRLNKIVPISPRRAYDMHKVIRCVFDEDTFMALSTDYAGSLITGFARLAGRAVAVLASQPMSKMGCLDVDSSKKGAEFLDYANAHGLPVITLVDTTGYLPGLAQEQLGVLREGARLIRAYAQLTVPTISVTLRKSYGGANVLATASKYRIAFPTAEVAAIGAQAAAHIALGIPETEADRQAQAAFCEDWQAKNGDAWRAAEHGFFDVVIDPKTLRDQLCKVLKRSINA